MSDLPSFDLTGRTALVTGAARGLGRATALALAAAGADVALGLRDVAADGGLTAEIEAMGRRALPLAMDVLDLKQACSAIDTAIAQFGHLDILVNNAGGGTEGPVEDFPEDEFDFTINLNVKSTFFLSQHAGRHMIARKSGAIINMGSQAGSIALPGEAIYCLSKAAVGHMTKCFAVEWGQHNVRVNCVAPTFIRTDGTAEALSDPDFRADVLDRIAALHRIGEPKEVSGVVVFLASDAASMITGQTILVDGGWTAR
ncbi:2-deoxy-D-gluconate 3-dehydrogenase [Kaistia sp. 32K]|uniref:SDR family NAD(P)-dependent oxidoreductase n=1 Tax=Kaistia sp. 32K TaxID=2795690 RepID=UPI001915D10F|nr:glucose 1-dehydrogenase [Kaistia sp. 32K]BCP52811.1 2-deoxy-D-gluconate 3-dehydrogenase [Kaistia sp. 32K]